MRFRVEINLSTGAGNLAMLVYNRFLDRKRTVGNSLDRASSEAYTCRSHLEWIYRMTKCHGSHTREGQKRCLANHMVSNGAFSTTMTKRHKPPRALKRSMYGLVTGGGVGSL